MFAGLASPSHLIIVLVIILLLFGAKRIPELAKGMGAGINELRGELTSGDDLEQDATIGESIRGNFRGEGDAANDRTPRTRAAQRRNA